MITSDPRTSLLKSHIDDEGDEETYSNNIDDVTT